MVQPAEKGMPFVLAEAVETGRVGTKPLTMVDEVLSEAKVERERIEVLAIGLGPGSYTGIRTGIALGQGWQLAREVKLLGISSAECIAAEAQELGISGQVAIVIDAQRGEFYLTLYELSRAGRRELEPLRLASHADVQLRLAAGAQLIGPEIGISFPQGRLVLPSAGTLGRLAVGRNDFIKGEELEPIYLRQTAFVKARPPITLPS